MTDWTQQPPPPTLGGRMRAAGRGAESMLAEGMDAEHLRRQQLLSPQMLALLLALDEVCRSIRAEPGVSMRTCSGRLHSAVGIAENLVERYRP